MPAWWRGKYKSKSKASPRKSKPHDDEGDDADEVLGISIKPKARSFDGVSLPKKPRDPSPIGAGPGSPLFAAHGHRLPLPCELAGSAPPPTPQPYDLAATSVASVCGSISASSVSSSASTDDAPDLAFFRYVEPVSTPRDRNVKPDIQRLQHVTEESHTFLCNPILEQSRSCDAPISPRKEFSLYNVDMPCNGAAFSHGRSSLDTIYNRRLVNAVSSSSGHPFHTSPTSPIHHRAFSIYPESNSMRQDDLKSPPHPLPLPPSSPSCSTPRSLQSHWKKGKLLGRGTFGHVFQGFNSEGGQMCAIKEVTIISDDSNSKECLRQLNQEISLLSQLSHPNIVQYYGSELVEDTLSVYLEYVSGGSIHKLLQEYGPFKEPVIRSYTGQILSGLAYLHGRNTVHRDIKGANILVDPSGEIKLADFGMAKHMSAYTSIRSFKGSPYWMAPEVIMNSSGYNLSVDIWSLGCTILEMATSKPPWSQYEGVAAIFKIGNSKEIPDIPEHFSADGKHFLRLCFQRDPSARPTAAQLMEHPFVRDQATTKASKGTMFKEILPSPPDGNHTLNTRDLSSRRSLSPLRTGDCGIKDAFGLRSALNASDLASMRMNMSLPVSPCSSPLRQFSRPNRSCLPSPPHPAYSTGAINYGPSSYSLYPTKPSSNFVDPWPDINPVKLPTTYDSPRKSPTPYDSPRRCL